MRDKELAWKIKRSKNITSSCIKKLNTGGRKKEDVFGLTAISYINEIVTQIKENDLMQESDRGEIWQMQFGKDNEPLAIEWWRNNFMEEIKHGSTDFSEILFLSPFVGFSDSPDALVYENDEVNWCEIKCPANKTKACNLTDGTATLADVVDEYRDQFIGHFLALPNSEKGYYIIYNAHVNELTGKPYNRGVRFILRREDFEPSITLTEKKIERVYQFILECVAGKYKPEDVNEWWNLTKEEE